MYSDTLLEVFIEPSGLLKKIISWPWTVNIQAITMK